MSLGLGFWREVCEFVKEEARKSRWNTRYEEATRRRCRVCWGYDIMVEGASHV